MMKNQVQVIACPILDGAGSVQRKNIHETCIDLAKSLDQGYEIVSTEVIQNFNTVIYTLVKRAV